jgi:hypothetical protein
MELAKSRSTSGAVSPVIDPANFERHEGFRESTLAVFTEPRLNEALRVVGEELYTIGLEYQRHWPIEPEGSFIHLCRAGLADLRHLQGFFADLGAEWEASDLEPREERISRHFPELAEELRNIADALEKQLGRRRRKG